MPEVSLTTLCIPSLLSGCDPIILPSHFMIVISLECSFNLFSKLPVQSHSLCTDFIHLTSTFYMFIACRPRIPHLLHYSRLPSWFSRMIVWTYMLHSSTSSSSLPSSQPSWNRFCFEIRMKHLTRIRLCPSRHTHCSTQTIWVFVLEWALDLLPRSFNLSDISIIIY